jgi:two-component system, response regulator
MSEASRVTATTDTVSQRQILLVEDNAAEVALILRALARNCITNPITIAHDGVEALDLLVGQRAMPFGLVLLDLKLPKIHGLEVLKQLRNDRRTKIVPVVILTTSKDDTDLRRAYASGANSYVIKSIDFGEFIDSVGRLSHYWLLLNQSPPALELMSTPSGEH